MDPEPGTMGHEPRARDRGRRDHSTTDKRDESPGAKLSAAGWTNSRLPATGDAGDRQTAASETERQSMHGQGSACARNVPSVPRGDRRLAGPGDRDRAGNRLVQRRIGNSVIAMRLRPEGRAWAFQAQGAVRFLPIRSGPVRPGQRTPRMRRAPQTLYRVVTAVSRTRTPSPCLTSRSATETSPEGPQLHVIRSMPSRRQPNRCPSRRNSRSCLEAASGWSVPGGRSLKGASGTEIGVGFDAAFVKRNLLDEIRRDEPTCADLLELFAISSPISDAPPKHPRTWCRPAEARPRPSHPRGP